MRAAWLHIGASLLALASLILIIVGLGENALLWQAGLGCVAVAMLMSFATRWARSGREGDAPQREADRERT